MNARNLAIIGLAAIIVMGGAFFVARQMAVPDTALVIIEKPASSPVAEETPQAATDFYGPQAPARKKSSESIVPSGPHELALQLDNLAGTIRLSSPVYAPGVDGQNQFPLEYTCFRRNLMPPLSWKEAPRTTESYVVVLERRGKGDHLFWSWIVFDLDSKTLVIPAKDLQLVMGMNDHGHVAYTGPCHGKGAQKLAFRIFALDKKLGLPAGSSKRDIIEAMNGHIIDAAELPVYHFFRL